MNENFLIQKLEERKHQNAFRQLRLPEGKIDFCSNDYLGIASNNLIENRMRSKTPGQEPRSFKTGSTGSRLLAGNYSLMEETEGLIAAFHEADAGLIFNSGYDANIGLLSCVAGRRDTIIYDSLSHASIRDGIRLSQARSFAFRHNDMEDLRKKLQHASGTIFVVTESVFSMDGDQAPLLALTVLCEQYRANVIVDEAHATGVIGSRGEGLVQLLGLQKSCFARVHTFGKACGVHGAIVLGGELLRSYLVNFSRAFIFTTALPEASVEAIKTSYEIFPGMVKERAHIDQLIRQFQQGALKYEIIPGVTPIQVVIVPGNDEVKKQAAILQDQQLDIRPILYPTVAKNSERLRIVLHSYNTVEEVDRVIHCLR